MTNEKIYLLTDGCAWEINKQTGNEHPHSIEVVDVATAAVRYIKSGSKIKFLEGEISDIRTQEAYNKATKKSMSINGKSQSKRKGSQEDSKDEPVSKVAGV